MKRVKFWLRKPLWKDVEQDLEAAGEERTLLVPVSMLRKPGFRVVPANGGRMVTVRYRDDAIQPRSIPPAPGNGYEMEMLRRYENILKTCGYDTWMMLADQRNMHLVVRRGTEGRRGNTQ